MDTTTLYNILDQKYDLRGELNVIYSELDQVFTLTTADHVKHIIKISHPDRPLDILLLEQAAITHLKTKNIPYSLQSVLLNVEGSAISTVDGYHIRVMDWLEGHLLAEVNPITTHTRHSVGHLMGTLSRALFDFDHPSAHRFIKWDPAKVMWIEPHLTLIPEDWQSRFGTYLKKFNNDIEPKLAGLPWQVNYNDANDYNLLCRWKAEESSFEVTALIDWLDMVYTPRINELGIACAYTILKLPDPLQGACDIITAYHKICPLTDGELDVLYDMIQARLMISVTVSAINKKNHPENIYLQVSDQDVWTLLEKWTKIHPQFAHYTFRAACNLIPIPGLLSTLEAIRNKKFHALLDPRFAQEALMLDLGLHSHYLGVHTNFTQSSKLNAIIEDCLSARPFPWAIGRYAEIRPLYTSEEFKKEGNHGPEWRTVHLGLDLFAPSDSPVFAPYAAKVIGLHDNAGDRNYGPTLILEHDMEGFTFFTLYGHLSRNSLAQLSVGEHISSGQQLGWIGTIAENGGWPPHLHFQIILDRFDFSQDFPGVASYDQRTVWTAISPDPLIMTGINSTATEKYTMDDLLSRRKNHLGRNLSISYKNPLWMRRGQMQYLIDHTGRRYLDTVNNVAHCGHEHPSIVLQGQRAMSVLNTNTRYLHENIVMLADQLTDRLDPELSVCYFTNSGTEANELAVRMARNFANSQEMITMQWGYHGNSNAMVDLSSYKFDRKGGKGKPEHTHVLPMPDPYRGIYAGLPDESQRYLGDLKNLLLELAAKGKKPAAFFAESILSCGGQIVYPTGYFKSAVDLVRSFGGLYIADEVQTGLGRVGSHFMAYELYGVKPDIVTIGKPFGNGHPIGAVVCTQRVAESFYTGMEYFNTFGGNPVSCAIASAVLNTMDTELLMRNAYQTGDYLIHELKKLQTVHPILADVRGHGFFLGIELIKNGKPATREANYLTGRMRDYAILMSSDGPQDNVLKIKPPMCFSLDNADELLTRLHSILLEHPFKV